MGKKKTATKKVAGCNCLEQVQEKLKPYGMKLKTALTMNFTTGKSGIAGPFLAAEKLDGFKGKLRTMTCAHCPFCGKKKS